jgi:predicted TIM-barrel fold metal-dependent hydrolase
MDAGLSGLRNPYLASAVAHAVNEWTIETYLSRDPRLWGSILVGTELPDLAAAEIELRARNPQMRQVLLRTNSLGRTLGHVGYTRVHEAAVAAGLPIAIDTAGDATGARRVSAGGFVGLDIERRALASQSLMTHLLGFIAHGVFERFPELKVVLAGGGVGWLTSLLWRVDVDFHGVNREVPWVHSVPSSYMCEHVRLTTFPMEDAPAGKLATLVELAGGPDLLVYGSGAPRKGAGSPEAIGALFPSAWTERILAGNALSIYAR